MVGGGRGDGGTVGGLGLAIGVSGWGRGWRVCGDTQGIWFGEAAVA